MFKHSPRSPECYFESGARCLGYCFGEHSSSVQDDSGTILEYFAEHEPEFEINEVIVKQAGSFQTESFTELQFAIFDNVPMKIVGVGRPASFLESYLQRWSAFVE